MWRAGLPRSRRMSNTVSALCITHTSRSSDIQSPVPLCPVGGVPALLGESLLPRLLWALRRPGLAPRRRSRVRPRRTSERDVGAPLISFNALTGHRSTPRRLHWPFYNASAGRDVGVRCHADGRSFSSSGDWGSSSPAFAISHGSRRRLSPAPDLTVAFLACDCPVHLSDPG